MSTFLFKERSVLIALAMIAILGFAGCGEISSISNRPTTTPTSLAAPSSANSILPPTSTTTEKQIVWCNTAAQTASGVKNITDDAVWISVENFNGMIHEPNVYHACRGESEIFNFSAADDYKVTAEKHMVVVARARGKMIIGGFDPAVGRPPTNEAALPFRRILYAPDAKNPKGLPVALYYASGDTKTEAELIKIVETVVQKAN